MKKPNRYTIRQFFLYNIGGASFFIVGYGVFACLYGLLAWGWLPAKVLADLAGWTSNYAVQRFVAFRSESRHHSEQTLLGRFSLISVVNVPIDYAIVGGLNWVGVSPFIGLFVSAVFFTFWKFLWYKRWVFKAPDENVT